MMVKKGYKQNRQKDDFYSSPAHIIDDLFARVDITGKIWENAAGDGVLSNRMEELGYEVYSSDKVDRGYCQVNDYLKNPTLFSAQNIVTNPPFKHSLEWVKLGLQNTPGKVIILQKVQFLESIKRYNGLFKKMNLEKVLVYVNRISFKKNNEEYDNGSIAFAWFVFDRNYQGNPTIEWIDKNDTKKIIQKSAAKKSIQDSDSSINLVKELLSKGYSIAATMEILKLEHGKVFTKNEITAIRNLSSNRFVKEEHNEKIVSHLPEIGVKEEMQIIEIKEAIVEGYDRDFICTKYKISKSKFYRIHAAYGRFYLPGKELNEQIKYKKKLIYKHVKAIKSEYKVLNGRISYKSLSELFGWSIEDVMNVLTFKKHRNIGNRFNSGIKTINDSRVMKLEIIYRNKGINVLRKEYESNEKLQVAS